MKSFEETCDYAWNKVFPKKPLVVDGVSYSIGDKIKINNGDLMVIVDIVNNKLILEFVKEKQ